MSPEFLTTLVVVATPGTGVLYTLAAGSARGARASVVAFQALEHPRVAYLPRSALAER